MDPRDVKHRDNLVQNANPGSVYSTLGSMHIVVTVPLPLFG